MPNPGLFNGIVQVVQPQGHSAQLLCKCGEVMHQKSTVIDRLLSCAD